MKNIISAIRSARKSICYSTIVATALITSCSSQHHNSSPQPNVPQNSDVYLGELSALPLTSEPHSYQLSLFNRGDKPLSLNDNDIEITGVSVKNNKQNLINTNLKTLVDITNCTSIPSHGQCEIKITADKNIINNSTGHFQVNFTPHEVDTGKTKAISSIISYYTPTDNSKNIEYSINKVGSHNVISAAPINTHIPFITNVGYKDIEVTSDGKKIGATTSCGQSVAAGTSCTLSADFVGGQTFNSHIIVTGIPTNKPEAKREQMIYLPISNSLIAKGNLLAGSTSDNIHADGVSTVTLSFYNNGTANISNITPTIVEAGSPLSISSNNCTGNINPNSSCQMVIGSAESVLSEIHHINISYNDSRNVLKLNYPINIIPTSGAFGAINIATSGSLENVRSQHFAEMTVTLTNSGNVDVNNLKHNHVGGLPDNITELNNTCGTTLTKNNGSCHYTIKYAPLAPLTTSSFDTAVSGSYVDGRGSQTISNIQTTNYSAINYQDSLTHEPEIMIFNTNSSQAIVKTIVITNTSLYDITSLAFDFSSVTDTHISEYSSTDLELAYKNYHDCTKIGTGGGNPAILGPGEKCAMSAKLTPSTVYSAVDNGQINLHFTDVNGNHTDYVSYSSNVINSNVLINATTNKDGICGSTNSHCIVYTETGANSSQGDFNLIITYTNSGSATATNFSVNSLLPVGYVLDTNSGNTTCPTNSATGNLTAGASCTVSLYAYNKDIFNAATYNGSLNIAIPEVSYIDDNSNLFVINNLANFINVDIKPVSTAIVTNTPSTYNYITHKFSTTVSFTGQSENTNVTKLKFNVTSPSGSDVSYSSSSAGANQSYCEADKGNSCSVTITYSSPIALNLTADVLTPEQSSYITWIYNHSIAKPATAVAYTQITADGNIQPIALNLDTNNIGTNNLTIASNNLINGVMEIIGHKLLMVNNSTINVYPILGDGSLNIATNNTISEVTGAVVSVATKDNSNFYVADNQNKVYHFILNSDNTVTYSSSSSFSTANIQKISLLNNKLYINTATNIYVCDNPNDATACNVSGFSFSPNLTNAQFTYSSINGDNTNNKILLSYTGTNQVLACTLNNSSPYISGCNQSTNTAAAEINGINAITKSYSNNISEPLYMTFAPTATAGNQIAVYTNNIPNINIEGHSNAKVYNFSS